MYPQFARFYVVVFRREEGRLYISVCACMNMNGVKVTHPTAPGIFLR